MARISTYALDEKITGGDKWIGSDSGFYNKTKNFTPLKLADYFNSSEKIDSTNSLRFWYQTLDFQEDRSFGTISFENEIGASVSFSSITSFLLSKKTEGNIFVYDFLSSLIDSKVLLHQGDTMNMYAIYEVTNIEEYELDSNFIKVDVSFIRGNGSLIEDLSYLLSVVDFALEASLNWGNINGNLSDQTDLQEALDLKVDISSLGDVAFSNDYNDLDNKPTIPTATSELTNDSGFITIDDVPVPDLSGLVPYSGATQDVDLGEFELKAGQIEFNTTPTGTTGVGVMRWNDSDGTLDLGLKGGNVTLQLGQEQVVRVVNKTGFNLLESNYQAVRVNGAQGQRLKVALAQATNDLLSAETIGLVTENINNNQEGFVTTSGLIRGINTTGSLQGETWADGDMLYLSPSVAGRITNIKPSAPNHLIVVGYVVYSHANNGSIFVKVDNGYELEELHNVTETNYTTPIDTDSVLTFDVNNSLWKRLSWANIKSNLKTYFDTIYQTALGFIPENVANKANDLTSPDNTKYPTTLAVSTALNSKQDTLTNPITGTGTTNYVSKFTGSGTLGNSQIFDNGTNVGIGTTSPTFTLDVQAVTSNIRVSSSVGTNRAYTQFANTGGTFNVGLDSSTGAGLGTNAPYAGTIMHYGNYPIVIGTNATERVRISNSGNVGIGVTNPQTRLDISNGDFYQLKLDNSISSQKLWFGSVADTIGSFIGNNTRYTNSLQFTPNFTSASGIYFRQDGSTEFFNNTGLTNGVLYTPSVSVKIGNTGNVGIGTTSPTSKLHIVGDVYTSTGYTAAGNSYMNSIGNTSTNNNANLSLTTSGVRTSRNIADSNTVFAVTNQNASSTGPIQTWNNSGGELMRVTQTGNVGIGTTSPGARLDVVGLFDALPARILRQASYGEILRIGRNGVTETASINYPADGVFAVNTASSERMRINASGNVGIGNTSPTQKLDVTGNIKISNNNSLMFRNAANNADISIIQLTNTNQLNLGTTSSSVPSVIALHTNSTERMRITAGGNVGIGTSSPTAKLHVEGSFVSNSPNANFLVDSTNQIKASVTSTTHGTGAGFELIDNSAAFGFNPFGDFRGVRADYDNGVWFVNESGGKLGLQPVDNNLWSEGNIIQTAEAPSNKTEPVAWIKIYNNDNSSFYFMPVYQ